MSEKEMGFEAQVQRGGRVTIPIAMRESLHIQVGNYVFVSVQKAKISPVGEKGESKK